MLRPPLVAGVAASALACGLVLATEPAEQAGASPPVHELETILVVGEQPGPGLWKVSKGDHVMWVLASYSRFDFGLMRAPTMLPSLMKLDDMPDDRQLQDVLAPSTYEKWHRLREKYMGHPKRVERMRPTFAIQALRSKAYDKNDLRGGPSVSATVNAAARGNLGYVVEEP